MAIMGTGLEYSRPEQAWHAGLYSDIGLADGPLKYFHVDQADHLPKAMIYATPVDDGQRSHRDHSGKAIRGSGRNFCFERTRDWT